MSLCKEISKFMLVSVEISNKHQVKKLTVQFLGIKWEFIIPKMEKMFFHPHLQWNRGHRPGLWHERSWLNDRNIQQGGRTYRLWKGLRSEGASISLVKAFWNLYSLTYWLLLFFRVINRKMYLSTSPAPMANLFPVTNALPN